MKSIHTVASAALTVFVGTLLVSACGGEKKTIQRRDDTSANQPDTKEPDSGTGGAAATAAFPADKATATIKGIVKFDGKAPRQLRHGITGDSYCVKAWPEAGPYVERQRVAENGGVPYALVEIKGAEKLWKFEVPSEPVVINQKNCQYHPHTAGAMAGQKVIVTSDDGTDHNVHLFARLNRPSKVNFTQKKGAKDEIEGITKPEKILFKFDIHNWMSANLFVLRHPLYAVTDEKGEFTLPKLPAGTYTVTVRHEYFKKATPAEVTVGDGETKSVELKIKK